MLPYSTQVTYQDSSSGRIFAVRYLPSSVVAGNVVFIPPFAEEMNKCRPMMTRQARRLAAQGFSSTIFDLYGTGDSEGDFGQATWSDWVLDVLTIIRSELIAKNRPLWLIGVRLGAILALEALGKSDTSAHGILLWNPVLKGKTHMNQFLRLRLASGMFAGEKQPESVTDLRQSILNDKSIEVAGYQLDAGLISSIDSLQIQNLFDSKMRIWLMETIDGDSQQSSFAAQKILDQSRTSGADISLLTVNGPPYWATQEIAVASDLIQRSSEIIVGET